MSIFCSNCGNKREEGDYCPVCGNKPYQPAAQTYEPEKVAAPPEEFIFVREKQVERVLETETAQEPERRSDTETENEPPFIRETVTTTEVFRPQAVKTEREAAAPAFTAPTFTDPVFVDHTFTAPTLTERISQTERSVVRQPETENKKDTVSPVPAGDLTQDGAKPRLKEKLCKFGLYIAGTMLLTLLLPLFKDNGAIIVGIDAFGYTEGYVYLAACILIAFAATISSVHKMKSESRFLKYTSLILAAAALALLIAFPFSYALMYGYVAGLLLSAIFAGVQTLYFLLKA